MKKQLVIKTLSMLMAIVVLAGVFAVMGASAAVDPAKTAKYTTGTKIFEKTFNKAQAWEETGFVNIGGEAVDAQVTDNGLVLATKEGESNGQLVRLYDHAPSTEKGTAYTIVMRGSMNAEAQPDSAETKNMLGIMFNSKADDNKNYCYAAVRSSCNFDLNRNLDGKWQKAGYGSTRNRTISFYDDYAKDQEFELIVRVYSDEKVRLILNGDVTYDITDNYREGTGIGLYVRQCVATISYFAVYEDKDTKSTDDPIVEDFGDLFGEEEEETTAAATTTAANTTAAPTKSTTAASAEKSGCGSFVVAVPALVLGCAAGVAFVAKKKED